MCIYSWILDLTALWQTWCPTQVYVPGPKTYIYWNLALSDIHPYGPVSKIFQISVKKKSCFRSFKVWNGGNFNDGIDHITELANKKNSWTKWKDVFQNGGASRRSASYFKLGTTKCLASNRKLNLLPSDAVCLYRSQDAVHRDFYFVLLTFMKAKAWAVFEQLWTSDYRWRSKTLAWANRTYESH